jgi:hypothetical protein
VRVPLVDGINLTGFVEAGTIRDIVNPAYASVPATPGVYLVRRSGSQQPTFLQVSRAGRFKSADPSYPPDVVRSNWVPGATVLYVGKTDSGRGLRHRLSLLTAFAAGKPVAHRGGRMLWHLTDWPDLVIAYRTCERGKAGQAESDLIDAFRRCHGVRPFANMTK